MKKDIKKIGRSVVKVKEGFEEYVWCGRLGDNKVLKVKFGKASEKELKGILVVDPGAGKYIEGVVGEEEKESGDDLVKEEPK